MNAASIIQRLRNQTQTTTSGGLNMSLINQLLTNQFNQQMEGTAKNDDRFTEKEKDSKMDFNEDFLAKLIDNTVGHYCLKLFTMIVNAFSI